MEMAKIYQFALMSKEIAETRDDHSTEEEIY